MPDEKRLTVSELCAWLSRYGLLSEIVFTVNGTDGQEYEAREVTERLLNRDSKDGTGCLVIVNLK
jgi:hypothetical protein